MLLAPLEAAEHLLSQYPAPARLLIAISGGSDSTGLLLALSAALKQHRGPPISLIAATIDHGLRPEAAAEARRVAEICAALDIQHSIRRWDGEKPASGISAAARAARYRLLGALAEEQAASAILTGHTLDDQFETIAMRQSRGDGAGVQALPSSSRGPSPGLAGMAPAVILARRHFLLRPLLSTRRAALRAFLADRGIGWIEDPSNEDARYERARIRQALPPVTDAQAVARLSDISAAGARRTGLADAAADLFEAHLTLREGVVARLAADALAMDPPILSHAVATLIAVLGGRSHLVASHSMRRVETWLSTGDPGRLTVGRVMLQRRRDALFLVRESRDLHDIVIQPGEARIWDDRFRIENNGDEPVHVGPHAPQPEAAAKRFEAAPPAVALSALRALPRVRTVGKGERQKVTVEPMLAPFDQFAAQFDWNVVNSLAIRMGLACFPPCPFNVFARKS
jgi:tRNA(Ile)-lysidine synthase